MKDGMYVNIDKQRADHYFHCTERFADFLEWLFDKEIWWATQNEMWEKFEAWEEKQNAKITQSIN